jgi:ABC-type lipoprotein release transport system permease subunit
VSARAAARLAAIDLRRHWRRLAGAGAGIALAVAAVVFLLSLGLGLRSTLLDKIFPLDRLEVAAEGRSLDLFAVRLPLGGDTLDSDTVARLAALPGVRRVYPKMKLTVPAVASGGGWLLGSALQTELVADGIDPELVADEVGPAFRFEEPSTSVPCRSDADCGRDGYCTRSGPDGAGSCRPYVPVIVSPHLLEPYNSSIRRAYRLPQLDPDRLIGVTAELSFGASMFWSGPARDVIRERVRLVGFSDRAIPIGLTMPLEVVRDLNVRFSGSRAADAYHSAIVELESPRDAPAVIDAIDAMGLAFSDRGARRAADSLTLLLAIIATVGAAVLAVAVISVAHAFFLTVTARRRELAVLRAVGATRGDLRGMVIAEASFIGAVAGAIGVFAAAGGAALVDRLAVRWVPAFPYRPDSFFELDPWLVVAAIAGAAIAAVVGALPAIRRAAASDPAQGLIEP